MSDENIKTLLTEEKWTRATISSYTIPSLQELDSMLDKVETQDELLEIKKLCDEHLQKTRGSIVALYISGSIALRRRSLDYSAINTLIELFNEKDRYNIVEFLCNKVLAHSEEKYVLRMLAACYEKLGKDQERYSVYERLVKVDFEETDLLQDIAQRYMEKQDKPQAIVFYKKAMQRYINALNYTEVKDLWEKLLEMIPDDPVYFIATAQRIASKFQNDRAALLIASLLEKTIAKQDWDRSIQLLKWLLDIDPKNQMARDRLVSCYRQKHTGHGRLETCIDLSNLDKDFRDVHSAIEDFERNIAFDKGSFVFHKTWNIGRIKEIRHDTMVIDFISKRNHSMSMGMAFSSLQVLPKQHIWVLKSVFPKEKLAEKFLSDIAWGIKTLISSGNNEASLKDMKNELVPAILDQSSWSTWLNQAKKVLMSDPMIGIKTNGTDIFTLRDTPLSFEEKTLALFKSEKKFYQKIRLVKDFIADGGDPESEYFIQMVQYFTELVESFSVVTDQVVASWLFVSQLSMRYSFVKEPANATFTDMYPLIKDVPGTFGAIEDSELKKAFIDETVRTEDSEKIESVLVAMYPHYLTSYIMDTLREQGRAKVIEELFRNSVKNYKENAELFTYLVRNYDRKYWEKRIKVPAEVLISSELQLLDFALNAIEAKKQQIENRKIVKTLSTILFDERQIFDFIRSCSEEQAQRINFIVQRMQHLEPSKKIEVKHEIMVKFPDIKLLGEEVATPELVSSGLLVTAAKHIEKQAELERIMNVDIPENSKEIGYALSLGDLRENSEFKAAKERQGILNTTMMRLTDELSKATIVSQAMVDASKISFGTEVQLQNHRTGAVDTYRIFGPWESDPSKNTISYLAPFGAKLLNHVQGERFMFEINEQTYDFTVLSIRAMQV